MLTSLLESPAYFQLCDQDEPSIVLKPLNPEGFAGKKHTPSSFMILRVSLHDDPTGLQIANWLKSFRPQVVRDVDIEALVLKARNLENLKDHKDLFPGSVLGRLSHSAQAEIIQSLQGLARVVTTTAALAAGAADSTELGVQGGAIEAEVAEKAFGEMKDMVTRVCETVQDEILFDPDITLNDAASDEVVVAVDAKASLTLRQYVLEALSIPDTPELPTGSVKFDKGSQVKGKTEKFRYGAIAGKSVVVESFQYTAVPDSTDAAPTTTHRVKAMVTQLSLPECIIPRVLPCVGYIQERLSKHIGLVFEMGIAYNTHKKPATLHDLYSSRKRVPLGVRIQLAHALAVALQGLHRVGWVHKELQSKIILFFPKPVRPTDDSQQSSEEGQDIDLAEPYLFGFEWSRPEDADSELKSDFSPANNAYRHPDRWGKPSVKFIKAHDVYSLVRKSLANLGNYTN